MSFNNEEFERLEVLEDNLTDMSEEMIDLLERVEMLEASVDMPLMIFKRLDDAPLKDLALPSYATGEAAGMDVRANIEKPIVIDPGERQLISTGLSVQVPMGFEVQVRSRSGLALKNGISVLNSPGTIDSDYRGPIGVILHNAGSTYFTVNPGDRIAQLVVARVARALIMESNTLDGSERGAGGFGSTGLA